jgi:Flp pilus assembly protein TadG
MRRLVRIPRPVASGSARGNDRGAVALLVALLLGAGALTGLLGLVVDGGRLYAERRVVQNGADAAALAVAQNCALERPECASQASGQAVAGTFANLNASDDGRTSVTELCGSAPLVPCPSIGSTPKWSDCQTDVTGNYARVRTRSEDAAGSAFFLPIFAGVLSGSSDELTVGACSQVKWGGAKSAPIQFPFLLPACAPLLEEGLKVIEDFDPNDPSTSCTVNGITYNPVTKGFAFGTLPGANTNCATTVTVDVGDVIAVETSLTQVCGTKIDTVLDPIIAAGNPIVLPVVGAHTRTGQGNYDFTILSFKSFTLTGYKLKNITGGTPPPGGWSQTVCGQGAQRSCLYGSVGADVVVGDVGGPDDFGVRAVQLIP